MTDFKLLEDLCRARGISGQEAAVRELIMDQVKPYADQITLDNLGNLLVFKQGAERPKTKLMLSAHMDEVGFIDNHVTENGFLKVAPVGGIDKRVVPGKRVLVGDQGIPGVIGIQPSLRSGRKPCRLTSLRWISAPPAARMPWTISP